MAGAPLAASEGCVEAETASCPSAGSLLGSPGASWAGSLTSLSLADLRDFFEGCWPMGGGWGDWGRCLPRREVITERRVGASVEEIM